MNNSGENRNQLLFPNSKTAKSEKTKTKQKNYSQQLEGTFKNHNEIS